MGPRMSAGAYDLKIPAADLPWAKQEAARMGARLLSDGEGGHVLLHSRLPAVWAPWLVQSAPAAGKKAPAAKEPTGGEPRAWALAVPFAQRSAAQALGARWDAGRKCWLYKGEDVPAGLAAFRAPSLSWESAMQDAANGIEPSGWTAPAETRITPRPHQAIAAAAILAAHAARYPSFLLSDEVGLGKTISAWDGMQMIAKAMGARSLLIVSPLSVLAHWRDCAARMDNVIPQVLAINYDRLDKLFEMQDGAKAKSKKGLARRASAAEVDLVIFDESHKLKNPATARFKLAAKVAAKAKFCLYLSATAGQNPLELAYLGGLIAKATGASAKSMKDFEQWCIAQGFGLRQGKFGAWEWAGEQADCERLREILFSGRPPAGMRRRPEEIAGWPAMARSLQAQELTSAQRELYAASWGDFKLGLAAAKKQSKADGPKKGSSGALVEALRFRQKSSLIRVPQTVAFAADLFEDGLKPAISCAFKETAGRLVEGLEKAGLRCARIDGSQSVQEREAQRLAFQMGNADAIVFTIEEGISLHEGEKLAQDKRRALLIHDLRWSAIQMAQIEGRAHRDGKFAQAYWLAGEGTVEFKIARRVASRTVAMKALSGDGDAELDKEIMRAIEESEQPWATN